MSIERDPNVDVAAAATIKLAGRDWYVPPLPLRQILAITDLLPKLQGISITSLGIEGSAPFREVIRRALLKAYPELTDDDLLDLPITISELTDAIPTVLVQAGGKKVELGAGETTAASPSNAPIGAGSSPTS